MAKKLRAKGCPKRVKELANGLSLAGRHRLAMELRILIAHLEACRNPGECESCRSVCGPGGQCLCVYAPASQDVVEEHN